MATYPPNEIVDMIKILGECRNNFSRAERLYAQRYPDRRHPTTVTIKTLTQRASDGSMVRRSRHHEYDVNDNRVITILAKIYLDRHYSSNRKRNWHTSANSCENIKGEKISCISHYVDTTFEF